MAPAVGAETNKEFVIEGAKLVRAGLVCVALWAHSQQRAWSLFVGKGTKRQWPDAKPQADFCFRSASGLGRLGL